MLRKAGRGFIVDFVGFFVSFYHNAKDHKSTHDLKLDESLGEVDHRAVKYSIKIEKKKKANTSKCERNAVLLHVEM